VRKLWDIRSGGETITPQSFHIGLYMTQFLSVPTSTYAFLEPLTLACSLVNQRWIPLKVMRNRLNTNILRGVIQLASSSTCGLPDTYLTFCLSCMVYRRQSKLVRSRSVCLCVQTISFLGSSTVNVSHQYEKSIAFQR
jgi:hypothetical protein